MATPHPWKHGLPEAYTYRNGAIAQEFLDFVVKPSLAALEQKHLELVGNDDITVAGFVANEHRELINKTYMAFCLSIQSLWEQQLRRYMGHSVLYSEVQNVKFDDLEKLKWGDMANRIFKAVRGVCLTDFESYLTLNKLQFLGNACRHGDGSSSRKLFKLHPDLFAKGQPSVHFVQWSVELLESFIDAIVLFWIDLEILGMKSLEGDDPNVSFRIADLNALRGARLSSATRLTWDMAVCRSV